MKFSELGFFILPPLALTPVGKNQFQVPLQRECVLDPISHARVSHVPTELYGNLLLPYGAVTDPINPAFLLDTGIAVHREIIIANGTVFPR
jgi:hypothetical protein